MASKESRIQRLERRIDPGDDFGITFVHVREDGTYWIKEDGEWKQAQPADLIREGEGSGRIRLVVSNISEDDI
jgi:hypothetical protein